MDKAGEKRKLDVVASDVPLPTKRPRVSTQKSKNPPNSLLPFRQVDTSLLDPSVWKHYSESELPGADVLYHASLIDEKTCQTWYSELENLLEWYHPTLKVYGKSVVQSRAIAAFSTTSSLHLKYSGQEVVMHHPFPQIVQDIQRLVESELGEGVQFNHVMLNRYDDGNVYIGKHSDNKENKVIASLSLGAPRTFIMTPRKPGPDPVRWKTASGSLLIMQGDTQANWKHEIPKEPKVKEGRISLTFRQLEY